MGYENNSNIRVYKNYYIKKLIFPLQIWKGKFFKCSILYYQETALKKKKYI